MQITERREGNVLILAIDGKLDNANSDHFREYALNHIRDGINALIIDFSKTTYVASMGIRALFIPAQELTRTKGRMVLCGLNKEVENLFLIGGLLDLFPAFPTVDAALADRGW